MNPYSITKTKRRWCGLLKNKKLIRIRLKFAAAGLEYECGFSLECTLKENLNLIMQLCAKELNQACVYDGSEIITDGTSAFHFDPNMTLASYGLCDGSVLLIC